MQTLLFCSIEKHAMCAVRNALGIKFLLPICKVEADISQIRHKHGEN